MAVCYKKRVECKSNKKLKLEKVILANKISPSTQRRYLRVISSLNQRYS